MEFIEGIKNNGTADISEIIAAGIGTQAKVRGAVHVIRELGEVCFVILRRYDGLLQCVTDKSTAALLCEGMALEATGTIKKEERAPFGVELQDASFTVLGAPKLGTSMPLPISRPKMNTSLEAKLENRPIALRNLKERAVFKIQEGINRGFREYLTAQHFTEIHTPKIVAGNAEGGANVFKLEYFGKSAFLTQSPQFYKQMMVGVFDRVFESAPVFRAEKHNTTRHLNEYTSLDFEMGYIDSFYDIIAVETEIIKYIFNLLSKEYAPQLSLLAVDLPVFESIPVVRFDEAKQLVSEKYDRHIKNPYDLEPEEEQLIGKYFYEEHGSDFVFVTHYPSKKRPFYAMDDPDNKKFTLSFDLLFRGMEITTGGQRIHDYDMQVKKMLDRGMDPLPFVQFLSRFKHGMPPHGGLGLGLERMTMKLLGKTNVRESTLFPRDVGRLEP
jgi:nondiscriminating aspartyl-tRNA synthetase